MLQWGRDRLIAEIFWQLPFQGRFESLQWGRDRLIAEIRLSWMIFRIFFALQWGRDRLIAEMRVPEFLSSVADTVLQWGRDRLIAEITEELYAPAPGVHASMGPRSTDRGNEKRKRQRDALLQASMGPRSTDRGNKLWPTSRCRSSMLQWGRDRLIAEISVNRAYRKPINTLQWGRDRLIAEITICLTGNQGRMALQWGRDRLIAEIVRPAGDCSHRSGASMGPRSTDRGNDGTS